MKKYNKILLHPLILLFVWVMYLLSFASGVVRYYYIQNSSTLFSFLGTVAKVFWYMSPVFLIFFIGIWSIWTWNLAKNKGNSKRTSSYYLIGILSIIVFFFANYLLNLESSKYGNYLYATYGLTTTSVYLLSNTSLVILVLFGAQILYRKNNSIRRFKLTNRKIISGPAILILVWYSLMSFTQTDGYISYAKSGYKQQFENYGEIIELKSNTSENAKIVIPVQSSVYPAISNAPIVRYFLFPRILVSSSFITDQNVAIDLGKVFFITIHSDKMPIWPKIDTVQNRIYFKEGTGLKYSVLMPIAKAGGEVVYELEFKK